MIKGYRVEPGEVENILLTHPLVDNVVVCAGANERGDSYLAAYCVSKEKNLRTELEDLLVAKVPLYMVPSYFVFLDHLPLNPNGKVDRDALPEPTDETGEEYVVPGSEIQQKVAEVWQEVLGRKPIGINHHFFEMGGDSIKAIQVSARLLKHRLKVTIRDLFLYPTIKQLSPYIEKTDRTADQGVVSGQVTLTPIQKSFFLRYASPSTPRHHFNQPVMLYRPEGFDETAVRKTIAKLVEHHDALRMVYPGKGSGVQQINRGLQGELFSLEVITINEENSRDIEPHIEKEAARVQASIDLTAGPLVKTALFQTPRGDHLLIVIHHLVVDGVSWRIILEDFTTGYQQAARGDEIHLPEKTDSFKYWANKLDEYSVIKKTLKELDYWKQVEAVKVKPLPLDNPVKEEDKIYKNFDMVHFTLSSEETESLLTRVHKAYGTEINDILLAGLGVAFKGWTGSETLLIQLEGHGRESLPTDVNISRTVGWFTSQYPVVLNIKSTDQLAATIKGVKETMRKIPNKGIGYGILRYLTGGKDTGEFCFQLDPQISFNYLGQFDRETGDAGTPELFQISSLKAGPPVSPELEKESDLDIVAMTSGGRLSIGISYNKYQYNRSTLEQVAELYKNALKEIIRHCGAKEKRELTPSDFTRKDMDIEELAGVFEMVADLDHTNKNSSSAIRDIYSLTPLQEGMLYHWIVDKQASVNFDQLELTLEGTVDVDMIEQSFNKIIRRYDVLRTVFIYERVKDPIQVVLEDRPLNIRFRDISREKGDKGLIIEEFKKKDRSQSFNLSRDILTRITLFKVEDNLYKLIWSTNLILMDGWSQVMVFEDLLRVYRSIRTGESLELPPTIPYSRYITWLGKQDKAQGLNYWRQYLEGVDRESVVPGAVHPYGAEDFNLGLQELVIDESLTMGLNRVARENRVTVNTIFQAIWGLLLQRYNNTGEVVFGCVVSGRPPEVEGIERMAGLFTNTVPIRISNNGINHFSQLLRKVYEDSSRSKPYEYLPLAEIQSNCLLKNRLIHNIMAFENFPTETGSDRSKDNRPGGGVGFRLTDMAGYVQANYNFYIAVVPRHYYLVRFNFNSLLYSPELVGKIADHFKEIVTRVVENPSSKLEDIKVSHHLLGASAAVSRDQYSGFEL